MHQVHSNAPTERSSTPVGERGRSTSAQPSSLAGQRTEDPAGRRSRTPTARRTSTPADQRGSVTAEAAVALPSLLVVLAAAVSVLACVGAQLRCVDAARGAARAAARGDDLAAVRAVAEGLAPDDARVAVHDGGDTVEVRVQARVQPLGRVLAVLPDVLVSGRAVAPREPGP